MSKAVSNTVTDMFGRVLAGIPGITPLSILDARIFRRAVTGTETRYANSWLYILRACHMSDSALGYKFMSNNLIATIGYRHDCIYVLPVYDTTSGVALQTLCQQLAEATGVSVIIKKFDSGRYPYTDVRHEARLPLEDDTCPETYLDLTKLFGHPGGKINPILHKLERRARAFESGGTAITALDDLRQMPLARLEQFLQQDYEKYVNYCQVLRYLYSHNDTEGRYITKLYIDERRIRGLYLIEQFSNTDIGLYGGITTKDEGGITEWMDLGLFRELYAKGIKRIWLGGAENSGIAAYVSRFAPYKPRYEARSMLFIPGVSNQREQMHIRAAQERDIRQLADLYLRAYNHMDELGETWTRETARKFISHFYRRQPDLFLVAESERGGIIGAAVAAVQPWWDGNHLVEGELFVEPGQSDISVKQRLLRVLLRLSQEKYDAVAWDTIIPTIATHPLADFEQLGFHTVRNWAAVSGDIPDILERL